MIEDVSDYALENAEKQLKRDAANILLFGWIYRIGFERFGVTFENGPPENIYYFSDNSGGYTSDGVRKSIEGFLDTFGRGASWN